MTPQSSSVSVIRFPETSDSKQRRNFMRELDSCLNLSRPSIVIDCCMLRELDHSMVLLLLRCLEEAMKRHGDVRLAAIPRHSQLMFKAIGLERLFKIFDHVTDAVNSYRRATHLVFESSHGEGQCASADAA